MCVTQQRRRTPKVGRQPIARCILRLRVGFPRRRRRRRGNAERFRHTHTDEIRDANDTHEMERMREYESANADRRP